MIQIIRTTFISPEKPAGEVFTFNSGEDSIDCKKASYFMLGRDFNFYLIIKNGYEVRDYVCSEVLKLYEHLLRK